MYRRISAVRLLLLLAFGSVLLFAVTIPSLAGGNLAQCIECPPIDPTYEIPPYEMPGSEQEGGVWTGFGDGRLNPAMDEYYSVWCKADQVEIWAGIPAPQLIALIPIINFVNLNDGGVINTINGMNFQRNGDTITISGTNGNLAPQAGSKSFSLDACIEANGGLEIPPTPTPTPMPLPAPNAVEEADRIFFVCRWEGSFDEFVECLNFFTPDSAPLELLFIIFYVMFSTCANGIAPVGMVFAIPAFHLWRRKRAQRAKQDAKEK